MRKPYSIPYVRFQTRKLNRSIWETLLEIDCSSPEITGINHGTKHAKSMLEFVFFLEFEVLIAGSIA